MSGRRTPRTPTTPTTPASPASSTNSASNASEISNSQASSITSNLRRRGRGASSLRNETTTTTTATAAGNTDTVADSDAGSIVSDSQLIPPSFRSERSIDNAFAARTPARSDMSSPLPYGTPSKSPVSTPRSNRSRSDLGHSSRLRELVPGRGAEPEEVPPPDVTTESTSARTVIWGTNVNVNETMTEFKNFIMNYQDVNNPSVPYYVSILEQMAMSEQYYLNLDSKNLKSYNLLLYRNMCLFPTEVVPIFDHVINIIFAELNQVENNSKIQVRPFNIDQISSVRELGPADIEVLVSVRGMVVRTSPIIPDLKAAYFQCSTCNFSETVDVDRGRINEPLSCKRCQSSRSMELIHNRCSFSDKQMIKLQEMPEVIPEGQTPYSLLMYAYDDLVDAVQPGDRVDVTGVYRATPIRVNPRMRSQKTLFKIHVDVIHYKKTDKRRLATSIDDDDIATDEIDPVDYLPSYRIEQLKALSQSPDIYDKLTRALAPGIWELDDTKKGLLCLLFGGSKKSFREAGKGKFRSDINILLCGDPGTSKSQLLQYVHKISPRGIFTSGKGSSSVGLTAYITKDPETRQLVLESGALVLSDGGVCCIDEFDKMSEATRSVLHEAMEQQTISVAKAGIICTLNARTSILAAANPRESRWNPRVSIVENIQLGPTLLSRFDLIYLMLDTPNETLDRRLARHIVSLYQQDGEAAQQDTLTMDTLTEYISYARKYINPILSDDAARDLIAGYVDMRKAGGNKNTITATPRQLESLVRLSEALAKMRFSETVERVDVDEALRLVRVALQQAATDPTTGQVDINLITTGQSNAGRHLISVLTEAARTALKKVKEPTVLLPALLGLINEESKELFHKDQLDHALRRLHQEGAIIYEPETQKIRQFKG